MHETLQEYLQIMYNQSISDADKIDLNEKLKVKIMSIFKKDCEQADDVLSNTDELIEYYQQGKKILDEFRKYRSKFFKKKFSTLMGIEDEILYQYKTINFYGKLDAVIKEEYNDTLNLRIIDFKTSYSG